jgi:hypothetical protein
MPLPGYRPVRADEMCVTPVAQRDQLPPRLGHLVLAAFPATVRTISQRTWQEVGVCPDDVFGMLREINRVDRSFGGGEMQALDGPLPRRYGWVAPGTN